MEKIFDNDAVAKKLGKKELSNSQVHDLFLVCFDYVSNNYLGRRDLVDKALSPIRCNRALYDIVATMDKAFWESVRLPESTRKLWYYASDHFTMYRHNTPHVTYIAAKLPPAPKPIDNDSQVDEIRIMLYKQAIRCYNIIMSSQAIKALDGSHLNYNRHSSITFNLKDQKTLPALFKYIAVNVWDKVKNEFSIATNDEDLQDIIMYKGTSASIKMPIISFLYSFSGVAKAYELNINLKNIKDVEDTLNAPSLFN